MKTALIVFHRSPSIPRFLAICLRQAEQHTANGQLLPILAATAVPQAPGAVPALDEPEGFAEFRRVYRHRHTTQTAAFLLSAYERLFQIRHYCRTRKIERFVMIDSDVLWFTPLDVFIDLELRDRPACSLAIVPPQSDRLHPDAPPLGSAHCLLCAAPEVLDRLCRFCVDLFTDPTLIAEADDYCERLRAANAPGGICDMYAVTRFVQSLGDAGGWLRTAENNLNASNGYETALGHKRFRFRAGHPELRRKSDRAWECVSFLHFQGHAKRLMRACQLAGWPGVFTHLLTERLLRRRFGS